MFHSYHAMFACPIACRLISVLRFSVVVLLILANAVSCFAQVVIDAPPTVLGDNFFVNSGEILNVADGVDAADGFGFIGVNDGGIANIAGGIVGTVSANTGSVVNISGGNLGLGPFLVSTFVAAEGSLVNISGGTFGDEFIVADGSQVNISGGTFGRGFEAMLGSDVELIGGDFRLNGVAYTDNTIQLESFVDRESVFTGTLADGSTFVFSPLADHFGDRFDGTVSLTAVPLPTPDLTPQLVSSPVTSGPSGLRAGQTLTLQAGGQLRNNFAAIDATLNIEGGTVGESLEVAGSSVNVSGGSIGDFFYAYSGSQVNITGGTTGFRFEAFDSEVNVDGGSVGHIFTAHAGTELNVSNGLVGSISASPESKVTISGGSIGGNLYRSLVASSGSEVRVTGGGMGQAFSASEGSDVEFVGGEFKLNGTEFNGPSITLESEDIFTGTLADGSSFIFSPINNDDLQGVKLTPSQLPSADLTPRTVSTLVTNGPYGLRAGQTLAVQPGGALPSNFSVVNATLNVSGGVVGGGVEVVDGTINLTSGSLGTGLTRGPLVTTEFSTGLTALHSVVNISGGVVGERSSARQGSVVNISGGTVETKFSALPGSEVNISGGAIGLDFRTSEGSDVELIGGNFRLNGKEFTGSSITLDSRGGASQVFTGTLADGSAFIFSPQAFPLGDLLRGVTLTRVALPPIDSTPQLLDGPRDGGPSGLRTGQTLTVQDGGVLPNHFAAVDAVINVEGGVIGTGLEVFGTTVNVSDGEIGTYFQLYESELNISGGEIGGLLRIHADSTVNISGGIVNNIRSFSNSGPVSAINISGGTILGSVHQILGNVVNITGGEVNGAFRVSSNDLTISGGSIESLVVLNGSTVNVFGGTFRQVFNLSLASSTAPGSTVNIFGGRFNGRFGADHRSDDTINLYGNNFRLDGVLLESLEIGEAFTITERNVTLTGLLADGSPFSFDLNTRNSFGEDFFPENVTLTVTHVVPEPTSIGLVTLGCSMFLSRWRTNSIRP